MAANFNPPAKSQLLPVAVDVMGGDRGAEVVIEGALHALRDHNLASILVGREPEIRSILRRLGAESESRLSIHHASEVIGMEESPSFAVRAKTDASIRRAFELVNENKACAVVSPGNTGAVVAAGLFISGTIAGIARPAIASLIPKVGEGRPTILLDSGANVDCHAYQLVQFAVMGHYYAQVSFGFDQPRVALLSNGSEISKGSDITRSAAALLSEMKNINFTGYVEGRDISRNVVDVVVCDGFVGNVLLKAMEGCVELVFDSMKYHVEKSGRGKLGLWLVKPILKALFHDKLDPSAYGGSPLLGLNQVAIVCHGSSDARAIKNAVRVAQKFSEEALVSRVAQALSALDLKLPGSYEEGIWNKMGERFERSRPKRRSGFKLFGNTAEDISEEEG
jgi:glycerol-3-phosphate acyltransferase PlsX